MIRTDGIKGYRGYPVWGTTTTTASTTSTTSSTNVPIAQSDTRVDTGLDTFQRTTQADYNRVLVQTPSPTTENNIQKLYNGEAMSVLGDETGVPMWAGVKLDPDFGKELDLTTLAEYINMADNERIGANMMQYFA